MNLLVEMKEVATPASLDRIRPRLNLIIYMALAGFYFVGCNNPWRDI